jgi:KipI family sensor histidine kinase inhibitor
MSEAWELQAGALMRCSEQGWLIGCADAREARGMVMALRAAGLGDARVVQGLASVLVLSAALQEAEQLSELLGSLELDQGQPEGVHHDVEVVLDGEDLAELAERTGLRGEALAEELAGQRLEVAALGFSPGFAYLTGLRGPLSSLPRRATPRSRVPAGSLAVASGMVAIYPSSSPGGWWLLGRSGVELFDATRDPPALLAPGDTLSIRVVESLRSVPRPGWREGRRLPEGVSAVLEVLAAPPGTGIVDEGRPAHQPFGVAVGGPFDPERAAVARALVGGAPGAIELNGPGLCVAVLAATVLAVVDAAATLDGRAVPEGTPLAVAAGQRLELIAVGRGQRSYLAFHGGPVIEPVLGSMGTDSLAGLGPGFLAAGDLLGGSVEQPRRLPARGEIPDDPMPTPLRVIEGPQVAVLEGRGSLAGFEAVVSPSSNRVGIRLEPATSPLRRHGGEMASIPMVTGAIQLPPDGCPVILGPDHASLGGYPVVGVVIDADLGILGRLAPGQRLRFELVSIDQARAASAARAQRRQRFLRGVSPLL